MDRTAETLLSNPPLSRETIYLIALIRIPLDRSDTSGVSVQLDSTLFSKLNSRLSFDSSPPRISPSYSFDPWFSFLPSFLSPPHYFRSQRCCGRLLLFYFPRCYSVADFSSSKSCERLTCGFFGFLCKYNWTYSLEYNVVLISSHLFVFLLPNMKSVITTCYSVEKMKFLARDKTISTVFEFIIEFDPANHSCPKLDKIWPICVDFSKFVNLFFQ